MFVYVNSNKNKATQYLSRAYRIKTYFKDIHAINILCRVINWRKTKKKLESCIFKTVALLNVNLFEWRPWTIDSLLQSITLGSAQHHFDSETPGADHPFNSSRFCLVDTLNPKVNPAPSNFNKEWSILVAINFWWSRIDRLHSLTAWHSTQNPYGVIKNLIRSYNIHIL